MSEKKVVRRTVALALGVICIVLIAGLGGAMAYYTVTINSKDKTISQLNATIEDQNNTINQLIANITNLQNQNANLQAWLDGNETLLNQTQAWLAGNITYYNSQISSLDSQIVNLTNEKNQLQTWLNGNITSLEAQISTLDATISTLNATITQMEEWLARGPPADHLAVANTVQVWYLTMNLTKQFLFNCMDQDGTESNWVWLWNNGSISDAAAFMSIIINPANLGHAGIEFCRCDAAGGDTLSVSINGTVYANIFSNSSWGLIGYWGIVG
jgi:prefoldin subunit 5